MPHIAIQPHMLIPSEIHIIGRMSIEITLAPGEELGDVDAAALCKCVNDSWQSDPVVMHVSHKSAAGAQRGSQVIEYQMALFFPHNCKKFEVEVLDPLGLKPPVRTHFPRYWMDDFAAASESADNPRYPLWLAAHKNDVKAHIDPPNASEETSPLFLIAMHGSRESAKIQKTLKSLLRQTYGGWLVMLPSRDAADRLAPDLRGDGRVLVASPEMPLTTFLCGAPDLVDEAPRCEFSALLETGSVLHPLALAAFASTIAKDPTTDALYCDNDAIDNNGTLVDPWFKPDFNLDLLRSAPYMGCLFAARKTLLGGLKPARYNSVGAQQYSLALYACENARTVAHIPYMLCHKGTPPAQTVAASRHELREALRDHLDRTYPGAMVESGLLPHSSIVTYPIQGEPLVSIVIPNKDQADMLKACVESVVEKAGYPCYEIIVMENNSTEEGTFALYEQLEQTYDNLRVITHETDGSFNYSAVINHGVREAQGDYILTLNNDTVIASPRFLARMLGCCQRPEVGVVGARLLYPDRTIQHAGVVVTFGNPKWDPVLSLFVNLHASNPGYADQAATTRDCSVVTGACQMFSRATFDQVGGYEEALAVAFNDVDFCLKVRETGSLVVYEAAVTLLHFESASRGYDAEDEAKKERAARERAWMHARWGATYAGGDPYFNPNLDQFNIYCKTAYPHNPQWFANGVARQAKRFVGKANDSATYFRR